MSGARLRIYTDYKSPFAYIANKRLFEIEPRESRSHGRPLV